MDKLGVGMIGSGFVAEIHAESFKRIHNAQIVACASPTADHAAGFSAKHGIPKHFTDYRAVLDLPEVDLVMLCLPNYLHCEAACSAAQAKKHIICEKPLCPTLAEADQMIDTCRAEGVKLMYAEELCFTPKYVRAKEVCDSGAIGKLFRLKQCEKHDGPHMPWFWDVERSGGGVTLDMGCHAFEYFRWMLGKPKVKSVWADMDTFVHTDKTRGDDDSLIVVEFEGGARGVASGGGGALGRLLRGRGEIITCRPRPTSLGSKSGCPYAAMLARNRCTTSKPISVCAISRPRNRSAILTFMPSHKNSMARCSLTLKSCGSILGLSCTSLTLVACWCFRDSLSRLACSYRNLP